MNSAQFRQLLMADTFAHGRISNPTHPMWVPFESYAIIKKPTYRSPFTPLCHRLIEDQGLRLVIAALLRKTG